mgnify:FL=1
MPRLTTKKRTFIDSHLKSKHSTNNVKRRKVKSQLKSKGKSNTKQKNKPSCKGKVSLKLKLSLKSKKYNSSSIEPSSPELSEDDECLFDENQEEGSDLSDVTSTFEYDEGAEFGKLKGINLEEEDDKQGKKRSSRRDFRACFNNFFKQTNCVPHPSSLKIDADSEIRLQKQRQMIEMGRRMEEDENSDNLSDLSDCLEIYDEADEQFTTDEMVCTSYHEKDPEQVKKTLSEVPTGLEPVDHLIRLAKNMDDHETSADLFDLGANSTADTNASLERSFTDYNTENLALDGKKQEHDDEAFGSSPFNRNSGDCDLISPTSSFKILGDETSQPELASCYPLELPQYNKPSTVPEASIKISDYLKIDVSSDDSVQHLGRHRHNIVFPYRYNSDNLNLACLENLDEQTFEPRHTRALNKRALFYGNSEAMVSDGRPITLKDFLN